MKKEIFPKLKVTHKKNLRKGFFIILVIICTLAITRIWNKVLPEPPIIIHEVNDSIIVIHEYKIPQINDSLEVTLKKKLENLELLNNYEKEIDKRIKRIENKSQNSIIPNLISLEFSDTYKHKGYTQANANSFATVDCPDLNTSEFLDFKLDFFNPNVLKKIDSKYIEIKSIDTAIINLDENEGFGIRLKDNVVIQEQGEPFNLMRNIPIEVEDIEDMMN